MTYTTIVLDRDGAVATIRLNRPQRMNAVIEAMYLEIQDALQRAEADDTVRCLVITGSSLRRDGVTKPAFCAGADLKEHASGSRTPEQRRDYIRLAHRTCGLLGRARTPVVAAVNGPARGAGAELALSCDLVVMADEASLAFPETGLGTFVGGGVTHILPRLVGLARARELVLTGRVIDGRQAAAMGLAVRSVPLERLDGEVRALATALAGRAPLSVALAKDLLNRSPGLDLDRVLELEADAILELMETLDWREGVDAFAARRQPVFRGR